MKYNFAVFLFLFLTNEAFGQFPYNDNQTPWKNDLNWKLDTTWSDTFHYTGKPNSTKWSMDYWTDGPEYTKYVIITSDGYNAKVNDSFLSLTIRRGSHNQMFDSLHHWTETVFDTAKHRDTTLTFDSIVNYRITRPYTSGVISSHNRLFKYGYYEAKIRLPDDYHTDLYGNYLDNGFWFYNTKGDIDWSELDYEIVTGHPSLSGGPTTNMLTCNIHMEKPAGMYQVYDSLTASPLNIVISPGWEKHVLSDFPSKYKPVILPGHIYNVLFPPGVYADPSHFASQKIDPDPTRVNFFRQYENTGLTFNHGWHIFAYEWLPDQIKFYVDNKLWFRLEADYVYDYVDIYGGHDTIHPVSDLNLGMPLFLNMTMDSPFTAIDTANSGPDSLSMDIQYVRYYTLKKEACGGSGFFEPGVSTGTGFDLCTSGNYPQEVYNKVVLGDSIGTCVGCHVGALSPGRVSIRGKTIKFFDGFKVVEHGELYADDVDPCKLP